MSSARFLPCWASTVLRRKGVFSFCRREGDLINFAAERQHRCAGIKTGRAQKGGSGGYCCFWLPVSLWKRDQGSNGEAEGKTYLISSGWLQWSHSCRQATWTCTKHKRNVIMGPHGDLCKHFNVFDLNILGKMWLTAQIFQKLHYHFFFYPTDPLRPLEWIQFTLSCCLNSAQLKKMSTLKK